MCINLQLKIVPKKCPIYQEVLQPKLPNRSFDTNYKSISAYAGHKQAVESNCVSNSFVVKVWIFLRLTLFIMDWVKIGK